MMTLDRARVARVRPLASARVRAPPRLATRRTSTRAMVKQLASREEFNAIKAAGKPVRATSIADAWTSERAVSRRDRRDRGARAIAMISPAR